MAKNGHGGTRPGSGRKAAADKKKAVFIYIFESAINNLGGIEVLKRRAEKAYNKFASNVDK